MICNLKAPNSANISIQLHSYVENINVFKVYIYIVIKAKYKC